MMRTLDTYTPTRFMAAGSTYDKRKADFAVAFIQALKHTKGRWSGQPFQLIDWQEQIIRDLFGTVKADATASSLPPMSRSPRSRANQSLPPPSPCC
ncbi:phage terminase large subunit [Cutibacterium acnes JCM 18918]|nr:phage terminase large subunit [Cutibacterium acnes JCM 18918]